MWGRNDLALGRDPSTRFLPGLLAVLVYLAVLAAAERREAVLRLLRVTPGIADARPVSEADAAALLEPWLGSELVGTLPMPTLVDVRLATGQPLDRSALAERLENAAPGTTLDDHARWLAEAQALGRSIAATGLVVIVLVSLAAVLAVIFAVRTLQWTAAQAGAGTGPAGLTSLLSSIEFGLRDWIALVALPVGAALIATVTARASVLVSLARLP